MKRYFAVIALVAGLVSFAGSSKAEDKVPGRIVLSSEGETIVLEPYAANIVRVTLSTDAKAAEGMPGYGIVGFPSAVGWTLSESDGADVYRSDRMIVTVNRPRPNPKPSSEKRIQSQVDIGKFFNGSVPWAHIVFKTPDGKTLLEMNGWQQSEYNHKDGTAQLANDRRPTDPPAYYVGAYFASPDDEHYYGLGQNHEGILDHRGHPVRCWNDYLAPAAPSTCVPFAITNKGYGLLWDNPSKTTIEPGFNEQTRWFSEVGDRVSYFVIAGANADEIFPATLPTRPTICCPRRPTDISSASSAIRARTNFFPSPRVIAIAICLQTFWWWTGSTTQRWGKWTWIRSSGPIPRP